MCSERLLGTISWFIRYMKLRSLQNLTSRDIFLQKYRVNVSDIIVHLAEFSVSIFKRLQKKKIQHLLNLALHICETSLS